MGFVLSEKDKQNPDNEVLQGSPDFKVSDDVFPVLISSSWRSCSRVRYHFIGVGAFSTTYCCCGCTAVFTANPREHTRHASAHAKPSYTKRTCEEVKADLSSPRRFNDDARPETNAVCICAPCI